MKKWMLSISAMAVVVTNTSAFAAASAAATAKSAVSNAAKTAASNAAKRAAAPVLDQVNKVLNPIGSVTTPVPAPSAPATTTTTTTTSTLPSLPGITLPAILKPVTTTPVPAPAPTSVPAPSSVPAATTTTTSTVPAPPPAPSPVATAAKSVFSVSNSPLGTLLDNPAAKAVLNKYIPGVIGNPQFGMMRNLTLTQLQPVTGGLLSNDTLGKIALELAGIK